MNNNKLTFDNCTLFDGDNQPHMLIPVDMYGIPIYPDDVVYDECDREKTKPIKVMAIRTYDDGDGTQQHIIDYEGNWHYGDWSMNGVIVLGDNAKAIIMPVRL